MPSPPSFRLTPFRPARRRAPTGRSLSEINAEVERTHLHVMTAETSLAITWEAYQRGSGDYRAYVASFRNVEIAYAAHYDALLDHYASLQAHRMRHSRPPAA